MPEPHELYELYKQRKEEIKSIDHIFRFMNSAHDGGEIKGTHYSFILWGNGVITWYDDGYDTSFEEVFDKVPIEIRNELVFYLDIFK